MDEQTIPAYPTDLTEEQWSRIAGCIPPERPTGADRRTSMRLVVNAIRYWKRTGCPWRLLPHEFPHWRTVYGYFRQWQSDGTWKRIEQACRGARKRTPVLPEQGGYLSSAPANAASANWWA